MGFNGPAISPGDRISQISSDDRAADRLQGCRRAWWPIRVLPPPKRRCYCQRSCRPGAAKGVPWPPSSEAHIRRLRPAIAR